MPQFAADGLSLSYASYGDGHPVVLLHGFTSLGATWVRHGWVDALTGAGLRAITLDLPGHGGSGRPTKAGRVATARLAADVVGLLDELDVARASIVGFSLGAGVALKVAADEPDRLTSVVLAAIGDAALHPADVREIASSDRFRRNAELAGNDFDALDVYLQQGGWPGWIANLQPPAVPAFVVTADHDEYMPSSGELIDRLRPTKVLTLSGRGHHEVLMSDDVKRAVLDFLTDAAVRG